MKKFAQHIWVYGLVFIFLSCSSNSGNYYLKNGSAKYKLKDYKKAITDLTKAIELEPELTEAYYVRALCNSELNKTSQALDDFNKAIQLDNNYKDAIFNRAFYVHEKMGNYQLAIKDYDHFIELNKEGDNSFAYNNRGFAKYHSNDFQGALADINYSIELKNTNSYAFKNRALVFIGLDSIPAACIDLLEAKNLGFSSDYGDEVDLLLEKHCQ